MNISLFKAILCQLYPFIAIRNPCYIILSPPRLFCNYSISKKLAHRACKGKLFLKYLKIKDGNILSCCSYNSNNSLITSTNSGLKVLVQRSVLTTGQQWLM